MGSAGAVVPKPRNGVLMSAPGGEVVVLHAVPAVTRAHDAVVEERLLLGPGDGAGAGQDLRQVPQVQDLAEVEPGGKGGDHAVERRRPPLGDDESLPGAGRVFGV